MTFVGLLEADLQGATEYRAGGLGPFFAKTRAQAPFSLEEFLSRVLRALKKAGVTSVVTLFVDDQEAYVDDGEADDNVETALAAARDAVDLEGAVSFYAMLTNEDDDLSHRITVEGAVDHPSDEAALTVLDTAEVIDDDFADESDEEAPGTGEDEPLDVDLDGPDGEELVEAFLKKLEAALDKELALADPELEVWTDWAGGYDRGARSSSALPGVPGIE